MRDLVRPIPKWSELFPFSAVVRLDRNGMHDSDVKSRKVHVDIGSNQTRRPEIDHKKLDRC